MSEERRDILNMLSEGKIDVDQAERLLLALDAGQRKEESENRSSGASKHTAVHETLHSVKEALAGLGPMMGRVAGEITTEFQRDRSFPGELDAEELPPLEISDRCIPIEDGAKLYIRNDKIDGPGGGDLCLESGEADGCLIEGDDLCNLRVRRSSSGPVLRWSGGSLTVKVPLKVAEVYAYTLGGDADVSKMHCPVLVKSMGGNLQIIDPQRMFKAKTMGGNIRLRMGKHHCESSEAKTMGGNIRLDVAPGMPRTETKVVTMYGSIRLDEGFEQLERSANLGIQKAKLALGEGEPISTLKIKTMGGNIEVRRVPNEQ